MARTTNNSTKGRDSAKGKSKLAASTASSHPSNQNKDDGEIGPEKKNNAKGKSKLPDIGTDDNAIATNATRASSTRGLKRTQLSDPESPPRKKSVPTEAEATIETDDDWLIEAVLRSDRLIDAVSKRINERRDYNDIYTDRPLKKTRRNLRSPSPRQFRISSPHSERSKAPLPSQEDAVMSNWKEFYTRARAIHNKGPRGRDLEPVDLFNDSNTTPNAIDEIFEKIEKEEPYNFPKDDDPTLKAACEALSHALQKASRTEAEHDTPEIKQALDSLRKAYDEAAKSNTILMRYIDVEPPLSPFSPLHPPHSLKRILLARSWVKELITEVRNQSFRPRILVVGKPGSGKSVTLVGYLLFYLIAMGVRVILQAEDDTGIVGFIFDADGVRGISRHDAWNYVDGKPCLLLVSADGTQTYPLSILSFCNATIVVTSPNMKTKSNLHTWRKQVVAKQFVAPPPSCLEVVYLLSKTKQYESYFVYWMYQEWIRDFRRCEYDCESAIPHLRNETLFKWYEEKTESIKSQARSMLSGVFTASELHQLPDDETNMTIPSDLVTMERRNGSTSKHNIIFMTPRIFDIVVDIQQEREWRFNWGVLNMYFRDPETRVAAGKKFEKMFLEKFRNDLSKMPPCYEMLGTNSIHPQSPLNAKAAAMPWHGLDRQPALERISVGKDANGNSYSKAELKTVIAGAMDNDSPPIRFLTPCAQNWPTWDAAVIRYAEENGKKVVHVIFLQTTIDPDHDILAKGLNQIRDAIPADGTEPDVCYHYVLVLLVEDESPTQIPKWRDVLVSSKQRQKDLSWRPDNLRQYIMFIRMKGLFKQLLQD